MKKVRLFFTVLALSLCSVAFAQNITVKGTVTDGDSGEGIPFASLQIKGTMTGANTDADGNYSISVPGDGILVFSSVGYATKEVEVNNRGVIDVVLPTDNVLEETVVVAFGTSTKEAFTGSAKVVGSEALSKSQVTAVTDALAGAVAGVQLTSSNGAPGAKATIRIRGIGSISAENDPLIIVDGAPFGGDLNNINPSDIESMTVLKDAASNALYGARGANGVIMITTKKAKGSGAIVTLDAKVGVNTKALQEYTTLRDPAQYYEQHYKALNNYYLDLGKSASEANSLANGVICGTSSSGGLGYNVFSVPEGQMLIGLNGKLNPNATLGNVINYKGEDYYISPDDWNKYAYKRGLRQEYNASVSASNGKGSFYAALGYLNNQGITYGSDMSRISARLKADYQVKKWLKVGANMSYAHYDLNSLGNNGDSNSTGNVWAFTSNLAPIYPLYIKNIDDKGEVSIRKDANGFEMMDYGSGLNAGLKRSYLGDANALMDNLLNTKNDDGNSFNVNGFADFQICKGLKLTVNGTIYLDETRTKYIYNPYYGQFDSTGGTIEVEHGRTFSYNLQQLLNYDRTFGKHTIGILLGHEYYDSKVYALWGSKSKMFSQSNTELGGAAVDGKNAGSSLSEYNNEGYFLRAQYDYAQRYFISGSVRRDASSRFAPENRWGTFWSVGAAWILSKENWLQAAWLDELKLKASIGSQGNDNIGSYMYTDVYDIINSDGSVATSFSTKGNRDITWETNTNFNVGLEFGFIDRISGSLEFFNRKTTDMLYSFPVAPSLGYSSYYANVGDMYNRGIELDLAVDIIKTKNVQWTVSGNLTWLKNRITMLDEAKKTLKVYDLDGNSAWGYQSGSTFVGEGKSFRSWYIREYAGVGENGESLWYKNVYELDADGNKVKGEDGQPIWTGVETTSDYSKADLYLNNKSALPPVYGGFGTSLYAYGVDFSINFSYQTGGYIYDSQYASFMSCPAGTNIGFNYHVDLLDAWTPENKASNTPRFQYADTYTGGTSTRFLTKANYLNIENVNLGYTFPSKWMDKIKVSALRIYVAAENLGYWSLRKGFDPRQGNISSDASSYSPMRTISGGITIKF